MSNFQRYFIDNTPVFITAVCSHRRPFLRDPTMKEQLLEIMREVKREIAFCMLGYVILDDHFHWLILPVDPTSYPRIMQAVKLRFTRRSSIGCESSHKQLWQRRYWDHLIRSQRDLNRHLDYIHYNPVKHGYTKGPADYGWSSYKQYLKRGRYSEGWGAEVVPEGIEHLVPE